MQNHRRQALLIKYVSGAFKQPTKFATPFHTKLGECDF